MECEHTIILHFSRTLTVCKSCLHIMEWRRDDWYVTRRRLTSLP